MVESITGDVKEAVKTARSFVLEGGEQILKGHLDEDHGISISPGATALAALTQLVLGNQFKRSHQAGLKWLKQNRQGKGWGKVPQGDADREITRLVRRVLLGSQSGRLAKYFLPGQAQELGDIVLALGQQVVHGIEGPEPEETRLPKILTDKALNKLPPYGRPVVIAAAILAAQDLKEFGVKEAVAYLTDCQMVDGSWCEDIIATSLAALALVRAGTAGGRLEKTGQWLAARQYDNGGWPAFDQLFTWSVGLIIYFFMEFPQSAEEREWINRAATWLAVGQNSDGSYGSTPPFTHPDLDDTAVALLALQHFNGIASLRAAELLLKLQNDDGSWSTFPSFKGIPPALNCMFPVYIPSTDVTIHVLDALWGMPGSKSNNEIWKGLCWLLGQQLPSGEMPGTWYESPIYATAQTLDILSKRSRYWRSWRTAGQIRSVQNKSFDYLLSLQNSDGSWGSSVIETSLAVSALCSSGYQLSPEAMTKGVSTIMARQTASGSFRASYQGIYAKGWNYEEPLTTALAAIRAMERYLLLQQK